MDRYRKELRVTAEDLLKKWQKRLGVAVESWGIKRMKTRWGTCNPNTGRILRDLGLAKKPLACVEYVVIHELLHLVKRKHNRRFVDLMTSHLPTWHNVKDELNRFALSCERWNY